MQFNKYTHAHKHPKNLVLLLLAPKRYFSSTSLIFRQEKAKTKRRGRGDREVKKGGIGGGDEGGGIKRIDSSRCVWARDLRVTLGCVYRYLRREQLQPLRALPQELVHQPRHLASIIIATAAFGHHAIVLQRPDVPGSRAAEVNATDAQPPERPRGAAQLLAANRNAVHRMGKSGAVVGAGLSCYFEGCAGGRGKPHTVCNQVTTLILQ